jgi:hypothetical protein
MYLGAFYAFNDILITYQKKKAKQFENYGLIWIWSPVGILYGLA